MRYFSILLSFVLCQLLTSALAVSQTLQPPKREPSPSWRDVPAVKLGGDLGIFWNVLGKSKTANDRQASARGFRPVKLVNPYADYNGKPPRPIEPPKINAWDKPKRFESVMRRGVSIPPKGGIYVIDIELAFEGDISKAWSDPVTRAASGVQSEDEFREVYLREWASWFVIPVRLARQRLTQAFIGIYGPQPFRRDYWGIAGKDAQQIDGTHVIDAEMWEYIDPAIDFIVASVYFFYDDPGSAYYMAANVEENVKRSQDYSGKPVYVYQWLRFHNSNKDLAQQEIPPWMAEASAIVPFFSGASGIIIWGVEIEQEGLPYHTLSLYMRSLKRLEPFSKQMTPDKLVLNEPAHVAWKKKRPLIREYRLSETRSLVLALHPWQKEDEVLTIKFVHGEDTFPLKIRGRHTELFYLHDGQSERLDIAPE